MGIEITPIAYLCDNNDNHFIIKRYCMLESKYFVKSSHVVQPTIHT